MKTISLSGTMLGLIAMIILPSHFSYAADTDNATLTVPILKDGMGKILPTPAKVGQLVVISTTLASNSSDATADNSSMPFVIIVEVRDELGVPLYSQFAIGSLNPGGESEVGLSWTPKEAGTYELKAFALSDMNNPQILAPVNSSITHIES
jgi:hypothetical protein